MPASRPPPGPHTYSCHLCLIVPPSSESCNIVNITLLMWYGFPSRSGFVLACIFFFVFDASFVSRRSMLCMLCLQLVRTALSWAGTCPPLSCQWYVIVGTEYRLREIYSTVSIQALSRSITTQVLQSRCVTYP